MCKTYGYCRISRKEQSIERQKTNILKEYPDAVLIEEAYTGTKIEGRARFEKLLKTVKEGDTIVFDSVSRMSRSAEDGIRVYKELFAKGVSLVFLKEHYIDTSVYASRLSQSNISTGKTYLDEGLKVILLGLAEEQIRIAFDQAEKEVTDLHQRTKEGLREAKERGAQIGQKEGAKLITKKSIQAMEIIRKHSKDFGGSLSDAECLALAGCSRNSYYKYKAQIRSELTI